ncbi:alpha/beta hydrolase family protein [soil metagenome]
MPFCELDYFSKALQKQTSVNLILPDPDAPKPWNVMFLLHGLSDNHTIWQRRTSIERYVEGLPLLVVMPDGGRSFYLDAVEGPAYGTAIGSELPALISSYFETTAEWSITGLSMGGYGAFKLALDHPSLFTSAVSHSGALHFGHAAYGRDDAFMQEFRRVTGVDHVGGPMDLHALVSSVDKMPKLRFDCGVDDFLLEANRDFKKHLDSNGIPHEYEEFSGDHSWSYWDEHVQEAIAFHRKNLGF